MKTRAIAEFVGGELHGDDDIEIKSAANINDALRGQISFFEKATDFPRTEASCIIVPLQFHFQAETCPTGSVSFVTVSNPKLAFARIAAVLHPKKHRGSEIHPSAVVSPTATIGSDVFIGAFTCVGEGSRIGDESQLRAGSKIGDNVSIGSNCVLHSNVFVEDGCTVGNDVVLHSGVVIGADGFGYVKDDESNYNKFPQIGTVVIEDKVEIGANTCVDRGSLGSGAGLRG